MNTLVNLLKDYQIGTWCKRAAWVIAVIYIVQMALAIYNVTRQYGLGAPPFNSGEFFQVLSFALTYIPPLLFDFFILYAVGVAVDHLSGQRMWAMRRPVFLKAPNPPKPEPTLPQ